MNAMDKMITEYRHCLLCNKTLLVTELTLIDDRWSVAPCHCDTCKGLIARRNVFRDAVIEYESCAT